MLSWLRVKNFALIDEADIEFGPGFNVITGETGAGKSIFLDALSLILGERADKSSIRAGSDKCEVCACFCPGGPARESARAVIRDICPDGDSAEEIQLRRIITASSNRCFVNDSPVTLQTLRQLGDILVDIHAAGDHLSLFRQGPQLDALDAFANSKTLRGDCAEAFSALKDLLKRKEELFASMPGPQEAERLRALRSEIQKAALRPGEDAEISARHSMAANAKQIKELVFKAVGALEGGELSASETVAAANRLLRDTAKLNAPRAEEFLERLDRLSSDLKELCRDMEGAAENIDLNEREFAELEARLSQIQSLKRKHGPSIEDVLAAAEEAEKRLGAFEDASGLREKFNAEEKMLRQKLEAAAEKLSETRKKASEDFSSGVSAQLSKLGFLNSKFHTDFERVECSANGFDRINFMFSPNPGEAPGPLRSIASSGEISRVMLAVKTVLAEADSVPVLIFDEIDVNIGGETAVKVGEAMTKLSKSHQTLAISHLPQVAAKASKHFMVSKRVSGGRTVTSVTPLPSTARVKEIARMLGGGKAALAHAKEILDGHK
jgi:DNA repair protein RecN (Recombination protein N)